MKKKKLGDRFTQAFRFVVFMQYKNIKIDRWFGRPYVVHGIVFHEATEEHIHAWAEDDIFCYDVVNGKPVMVFKQDYYRIGKIKTGPGEIFKYDKRQAYREASRTGQYYFSKLPCTV